jgi:ech hydrogenase subunit F
MKIGTMLADIVRSFFRRPATGLYPINGHDVPDHARGLLSWDPTQCTGCGLCAKDCPAFALEVIVLDRKAKRFTMNYDLSRCAYCGQCVETCRFGCLSMAEGAWELAATDQVDFVHTLGKPYETSKDLAVGA